MEQLERHQLFKRCYFRKQFFRNIRHVKRDQSNRYKRLYFRCFGELWPKLKHHRKQWLESKCCYFARADNRSDRVARVHYRQFCRSNDFAGCFRRHRRIMGQFGVSRDKRRMGTESGNQLGSQCLAEPFCQSNRLNRHFSHERSRSEYFRKLG